jgi:hypothetical protein
MKQVPCHNPTCSERRTHWENPESRKKIIMVNVDDDFDPTTQKAYCSIECYAYDGNKLKNNEN